MKTMRSLLGILAVCWLACSAVVASAADDAERFLDALREQRYHDVAIDFLKLVEQSGKGGKEFREKLDYEAGLTYIESSMIARGTVLKQQALGDAKARLDKFVSEHKDHPLVPSTKRLLADVLSKHAQIKIEIAEQANKSADDKKKLHEEARALYQEAFKVFEALEKQAFDQLKAMGQVVEAAKKPQQEQLRRDLLETRLALASVLYEIAHTFPEKSQGWKDNLTESAKRYHDFYTKYNMVAAGAYARMWEGRSYRELGDTKQAMKAFEDVIVNSPDDPEAYYVAKNKARVFLLETAGLPTVKMYKEALALYDDWSKNVRGKHEWSVEGLAIKYLSGEIALEQLRTLKETDPERRRLIKVAKDAFKAVSARPGEYKDKARAKAQDPLLGGGETGKEPTTFADAKDRAKDALERMSGAQAALEQAKNEKKDDDAKKYEGEIEDAREAALKYYTLALRLAPRDRGPKGGTGREPDKEELQKRKELLDEINAIRYYLTFLYYSDSQLPEAAVLGEFVARRYPESRGGKDCARIALASYVQLIGDGKGATAFENQRLVTVAQYIAGRWAGQPEADVAWMTLIGTVVRNRDIKMALEYLDKIPANAAKRGDAEQAVGQLIWSEYLRLVKLPDEERPAAEKLDAMKAQAEKVLEDGIGRLKQKEGEITKAMASSVLYLAQIYVETGQADKAIALLDDPKIGAKTLVLAKHPSTEAPGFDVATLQTALRGYVATQKLDKAEETMAALEKVVKEDGDAEASKRLTQIYINLGVQLKNQLERLMVEGKRADAAKVAKGFETFLTKILQRDKGNNFNSLNWVAVTFAGLGEGVDVPGATKLSAEAEGYYAKANESYDKILARLNEPEFAAPANVANTIKIRKARVLRRLGGTERYSEAIELLRAVLAERQTIIDAQIEAAYIMQAWGNENPKFFDFAIAGSAQKKEIWGWGPLARKVQSKMDEDEKLRSVFHEARYNLAVCRLKQAQQAKDDALRTKYLAQASRDIGSVFALYPEMGGKDWYDKYDSLLKNVQKLKGEKATGLEGLRQAAEEAKKLAVEAEKSASK